MPCPMRIVIITCHLMLFFCFCLSVHAQATCRDTIHVQIRFRQGYSSVEPFFCDNKKHLDSLVAVLRDACNNPLYTIKSVTIKGSASPEGYASSNRALSEKRARNAREYLVREASLPDTLVKTLPSGVGWEQLDVMIETSGQPWSGEACRIIRDAPRKTAAGGSVADSRKARLVMLQGGTPWRYMSEHFFPVLRNGCFQIVYEKEPLCHPFRGQPDTKGSEAKNSETAVSEVKESEATGLEENKLREKRTEKDRSAVKTPVGEERKRVLLLKTNLLYDFATVPNVGVEIPVAEDWSVGVNWMYAWWSNDARHRYLRIYGGDVEVRRWFPPRREGRRLMCGHHFGLYGQMLTYDVEWGGNGYLGDRWSWGAGVSYGYSLPVGRQLNMDFTLGVGYLEGDYMKYRPQDGCYVWDSTRRKKWFGPTKAEISLVWYVGGRYARKGGAR